MKVILAEEMGMCFGVRDALKAIEGVERPERVTIHGQLVHNEVVLSKLEARGFRMISEERRSIPTTQSVLVTAHGISDRERSRLEAASKQLVDTTCPLVRRVHETAQRMQAEGYHIILIGRPGHVEVRGIVEDLSDFDVFETPEQARPIAAQRLALICQTTVSPRTVAAVHDAVAHANPDAELRFIDTTCQPTRRRQHSVEEILPRVQCMVVVGGRNSNNTRELADLCRGYGLPTFHVQSAVDLRGEWFLGVDRVGLTAGTSTLDETIAEVREWLQTFSDNSPERRHSRRWRDHFQQNKRQLLALPWENGATLTDEEKAALVPSLQDFQLGESSDGDYGLKLAARYAESVFDPGYVESVRIFFAEENRHAGYLKRYLEQAGVPTIQYSWTDFIFRRVRHLMGLETLIVVLLTAEMIGKVYYRAIRTATKCELLRRICTQILRDEQMHLRFHIERLRIMRRRRSRLRRWLGNLLHRVLFLGATIAVWWKHGRAIRLGGYGFWRFRIETMRELSGAIASATETIK
jgi:4-hydroxy-3-methylbut-2-enyl diphosphate reductase